MPSDSTFGQVKDLPDPAKEYNWFVQFTNTPGNVDLGDAQLYAQTGSFAGRTHGEMDRNYFNHVVRYAGKKEDQGTIDMTFYLHQDMYPHQAIRDWQSVITDPVSGHPTTASPTDAQPAYFGTMEISLASQRAATGTTPQELDKVKFKLVWPEEVSDIDLDYTGDGQVTFDVTWAFSTFEYITP